MTQDLKAIADQVPLGFECRSCGRSAYNWLTRIARYLKVGEYCCPDMKDWCERAERGEPPRGNMWMYAAARAQDAAQQVKDDAKVSNEDRTRRVTI